MKAMNNIKAELKKAIVKGLEECKADNVNPDDDPLWVMCRKTEAYTNEACVIKTILSGLCIKCKDLDEVVEKYADICLNAGATAEDIYLGY